MVGKKMKGAVIIAFVVLLAGIHIAAAAQTANQTAFTPSQEALAASAELGKARTAISEMKKEGFNTAGADDQFQIAEQLYNGQSGLENQTGNASYVDIIRKAKEIEAVRDTAFKTYDDLGSLGNAINRSKGRIDISEPLKIYKDAVLDFKSGRFDSAQEKINEAYLKISQFEESTTYSSVLLTSSKGIGDWLISNWKGVSIAIIIVLAASLFGYEKIGIALLQMKTRKLELERHSIQKLLQKTQEDYFNKGRFSESVYHIKIKKYGELIRDINRQLPMQREEIEKRRGFIMRKIRNITGRKKKVE